MKVSRTRGSLLYALTSAAHRLYPRIPVLRRWPTRNRIKNRILANFRRRIIPQLAALHRRRLHRTTFIGITGSAGKTMTKLMTGAVLRSQYRGSMREDSVNFDYSIGESILMARTADQFCLVELSAGGGPGYLRKPLKLLEPSIGVVTCIGTDHYSAFGSRDAIAAEKGRLIRELPEQGVAVLNADDPRVIAMRSDCRARVISFGLAAGADVRGEFVSSIWPERLSFELVHAGRRELVQTQLCGTQWVSAALAAAAVGVAMNIPLADIARSLGTVTPFPARMSPLVLPDGVTFIRDDIKASAHTLPPAMEFMRTARAARKLAIIGTLSDYSGSSRAHYVRTARLALDVCDFVFFVGPRANMASRARPKEDHERLRTFATVKAATTFFSSFLKAGDLVLLKGSNPADHLYRIALSRTSPVLCWRENCRRLGFCDACELVTKEQERQQADLPEQKSEAGREASTREISGERTILVGLGNPGESYANTPHNVGYAVVDRVATEAGADWFEAPGAQLALAEWRNIPLCLVKCQKLVNHSGPVLHALFKPAGVDPRQIILVFDDIDLPLGKVRSRMRGSDGGHRGVRSILEAFQTDQFRRIKIGVHRALGGESARDAVLRPFDDEEAPIIMEAIEQACSRLQEVVKSSTNGTDRLEKPSSV